LGYRCAAVLRTDVQRRPQTFIQIQLRAPHDV
jgi:hypothetical protein